MRIVDAESLVSEKRNVSVKESKSYTSERTKKRKINPALLCNVWAGCT
jgi:hypothetical protein